MLDEREQQRIDWDKGDGLITAVIQNVNDLVVLMVGFMNRSALAATLSSGRVYFYSRTRQRLWLKGETSGNFLDVSSMQLDCDGDTLLLLVDPAGPTCHSGEQSCFSAGPADSAPHGLAFLGYLEKLIARRREESAPDSYTAQLFAAGIARIAQKVGEEGVELALAAVQNQPDRVEEEAADLLYHLLVLLQQQHSGLLPVMAALRQRHQPEVS